MLEVLELKASMKLRLMQPLEEGRRVQRRREVRGTIWKVIYSYRKVPDHW